MAEMEPSSDMLQLPMPSVNPEVEDARGTETAKRCVSGNCPHSVGGKDCLFRPSPTQSFPQLPLPTIASTIRHGLFDRQLQTINPASRWRRRRHGRNEDAPSLYGDSWRKVGASTEYSTIPSRASRENTPQCQMPFEHIIPINDVKFRDDASVVQVVSSNLRTHIYLLIT
jgi:hypothetical protein